MPRRSRTRSASLAVVLAVALVAGCSVTKPTLADADEVPEAEPIPVLTTTTDPAAPPEPTEAAAQPATDVDAAGCNITPAVIVPETTVVATAVDGLANIDIFPSDGAATPCATVPNPETETGHKRVFYVLQEIEGWVEVMLPIRPNGSSGWVKTSDVTLAQNQHRIEVTLSEHRVVVSNGGETLIDTPAGIGTVDTPTPPGMYFVVGLVQPTNAGYGPFAYALSGHSETPGLETFAGGEGRLGLHGTDDPSSIGTDASHGCIRLPNDVITRMANDIGIPLGTPVIVFA